MNVYSAVVVKDTSGNLHDVDIYTSDMSWTKRLRAVRRWCESHGVTARWAYVGGNMWTPMDIARA